MMQKEEKNVKKKHIPYFKWIRKYVLNKYTLVVLIFLVWMIFFDSTSFLVLRDLDNEIEKYEQKLEYYKEEYNKNTQYYNQLMNNKNEKEKFARENYFMKKRNEEIFIIVADSTQKGN